MAEVLITGKPVTRYYKLSISTTAVGIPTAFLTSRTGQQVTRAVGVVHGGSVCMGMRDIINPTTTVGIPLAVADVVVIEGHDNIERALFIQDSGAAEIYWFLSSDQW